MLMAALVGASGIVSAQRLTNVAQLAGADRLTSAVAEVPTKKVNHKKAVQAVIFQEDFANGIPSTWTNSGSSAESVWTYETGSSTGSKGAYTTGVAISSPSVSNGFVMFDSDFLDNGGVRGAFGKGSAPSPHKGTLTTPSFDCTGKPAVLLSFNQYMRYFAGVTNVIVTNSTGTKKVYRINDKIAVNAQTARTSVVDLNISEIAANDASVTVAFEYDGTVGGTNKGYYFWMIDDVVVGEPAPNDVVLEDDGITFQGMYSTYTRIPKKHVPAEVTFDAETFNNTAASLSNVKSTATITKGGAPVGTFSSTPINLDAFLRDTSLWTAPTTSLADTGAYTIDITASSDGVDGKPANNTINHVYTTSVNTFGRDRNTFTTTIGTESFIGAAKDGFEMLNAYNLTTEDTVAGLNIYFSRLTTPGANFEVRLYDSTATNQIAASDIVTFGATDTGGKFVYIPFLKGSGVTNVFGKGLYYAALYTYDQDTVNNGQIAIGDDAGVAQAADAALIRLGGTLYTNGNAFLIRLVTGNAGNPNATSTINAAGAELVQNIPNPFKGQTQINYSLKNAANVTIEVTDVTGRKVMELNEGSKSAGAYQVNLDASALKSGIYFYSLKAGNYVTTKKMVITE